MIYGIIIGISLILAGITRSVSILLIGALSLAVVYFWPQIKKGYAAIKAKRAAKTSTTTASSAATTPKKASPWIWVIIFFVVYASIAAGMHFGSRALLSTFKELDMEAQKAKMQTQNNQPSAATQSAPVAPIPAEERWTICWTETKGGSSCYPARVETNEQEVKITVFRNNNSIFAVFKGQRNGDCSISGRWTQIGSTNQGNFFLRMEPNGTYSEEGWVDTDGLPKNKLTLSKTS